MYFVFHQTDEYVYRENQKMHRKQIQTKIKYTYKKSSKNNRKTYRINTNTKHVQQR